MDTIIYLLYIETDQNMSYVYTQRLVIFEKYAKPTDSRQTESKV